MNYPSPFRYPGGKSWLIPNATVWLKSLPIRPRLLVEPFAGGASVGLAMGLAGLVDHVLLIESDPVVAAVWTTLLNGDAPALTERILTFDLTLDNVRRALSEDDSPLEAIAFRTILLNRTNHAGILAPGSGRMNKGEDGRGLASRWYPKTLADRIMTIHAARDRFTFLKDDGLRHLEWSTEDRVACFADPPYTASKKTPGSRLYAHFTIDHTKLFSTLSTQTYPFLMTYDDDKNVRELTYHHGFNCEPIKMRNSHNAASHELLITRGVNP